MQSSKVPSKFYRYRPFNNQTLESLCKDSLYFARPETFNDPFDCNPRFECDVDIFKLRELLSKLIKKRVSNEIKASLKKAQLDLSKDNSFVEYKSIEQAHNKINHIEYMASDPDYDRPPGNLEQILLVYAIEQELHNHYENGICCFSESCLNPLLWSHYGDQHKGICIGYSTDRVPKPELKEVIYGGSRVIRASTAYEAFVKENLNAKEKLNQDFLLRKSKEWRYEKEWRLIASHGLQNSRMKLTEVIFGIRCPVYVIHTIIKSLAGRDTPVSFHAINIKNNEYTLEIGCIEDILSNLQLPRTATSPHEDFGILWDIAYTGFVQQSPLSVFKHKIRNTQ